MHADELFPRDCEQSERVRRPEVVLAGERQVPDAVEVEAVRLDVRQPLAVRGTRSRTRATSARSRRACTSRRSSRGIVSSCRSKITRGILSNRASARPARSREA